MNEPSIQSYTTATIVIGTHPGQVTVRLRWRISDPYAVELLFYDPTGQGRNVRWVFDRELLAKGLGVPAGIGDVHVRPGRHCPDRELTLITLAGPTGRAGFEFDTADLADFLTDTYDELPAGAEHLVLDLDAELADLLHNHG